nr:MAG TPA: Large polyvalent protein-associated domain 3 [Caudoviricetes sp.]
MELKQVKENVRKMVALGAPMEDIDGYIAATGYTVDDVKNYQPPHYDALDKTKYTLRAAGEGMTFGLGDVVAGASNTLIAPLAKTIAALTEGTALHASDFNPLKNFKEGRGDFVREQQAFAKEHPGLNMAGELGGGLITGVGGAAKAAGAKALSGLGKWGTAAAMGAGSGGAYGFGTGLTHNADTLDWAQGAKEGTQGAFLGGIFGVGAPAVFGVGGRLVNRLNKHHRAYRQLSKAAKGKLEESIQNGVPLIDTADKKALRLIQGANLADDEASELLGQYANQRMATLQEEAQGTLDKIFGKKGYDTLLKENRENGQKLAAPLYDKAFAKGRVNVQLDPYQRVMANELRRDPDSAIVFRHTPDNDFRFLDAIKRGLDYKISSRQAAIENRTLRDAAKGVSVEELIKSRTRLLSAMDKASPHYRLARSVAEQGIKFEEGAQAGQRAFLDPAADIASKVKAMGRGGRAPDWNSLRDKARLLKTPGAAEKQLAQIDLLETIYNAPAQAERSGYKVGAGQALRKLLEGSGANWENYYQKLFNNNRLNKLQALGVDTQKFLPEIEKGKKVAENMRNLFRGSQTAERMQDKSGWSINPWAALQKTAAKMISKGWVVSPQDIARMSIDPGYAALMRAAAGQLPASSYVDISGAGGVFTHISGPKTTSEKNINRRLFEEHLLKNIRGTAVNNPYMPGGKIPFVKAGINKAINSSANSKKLDLIEYAPEIAAAGKPVGNIKHDSFGNEYRYLMTPIKKTEGYDAAITTTKRGNFYNINPVDFYIKKAPAFTPRHKLGNAEDINSIAKKTEKSKGVKNKGALSMRDLATLLSRPMTLGLEGNIALSNNELADTHGAAFARALNELLARPYTRALQKQREEK